MMNQSIKMETLTSMERTLRSIFSKDDTIVVGLYEQYMEFYGIQDGVEYTFRVRKDEVNNGKN